MVPPDVLLARERLEEVKSEGAVPVSAGRHERAVIPDTSAQIERPGGGGILPPGRSFATR
jgi:hypothetical protein